MRNTQTQQTLQIRSITKIIVRPMVGLCTLAHNKKLRLIQQTLLANVYSHLLKYNHSSIKLKSDLYLFTDWAKV